MDSAEALDSGPGAHDPAAPDLTARPPRVRPLDEARSYRFFMIAVAATVTMGITAVFLQMAIKNRTLIEGELLTRARVDFENLALVRKWNADYGGVFVEKKPGMQSNPYLANSDVTDQAGKVYTKKNPALMTRELSELELREGYSHHMTSLRPLNPANRPDPGETEALKAFERGEKERSWFESRGGKRFFCYMAPLQVETSCLECHAKQGYKAGEVRGGISIRFDVEEVHQKVQSSFRTVVVLAVLNIAVLIGIIYAFFRKLVNQLQKAREELVRLAATDPLTGVNNRRVVMETLEKEMKRQSRTGAVLGCFILDLDRFKSINDRFGHPAGDSVLRQTAAVLKDSLRAYDSVGRYGGEEFLAVLPRSNLGSTVAIAERVRHRLADTVRVEGDGNGTTVTGSFGVALYQPGESLGQFLGRADEALYRAKAEGRNRVIAG